jgi:hemerythrin-like domain-containing protein
MTATESTANKSPTTKPVTRSTKRNQSGGKGIKQAEHAMAQRPVRLLSAPQIMLHLHNEHKYMTKLLNVMAEQLTMIDVGQIPDFKLMHEVMHYLDTYSDKEHHPREDVIYRVLAERDPASRSEVDSLLIEHETTHKKTESLLNALAEAREQPSFELAEKLRFRCEDYISTLNNHMDLEESQVFPKIREVLCDEDWAGIINTIQPKRDPLFGKEVEKHYQDLFDAIYTEMDRAANEFTVAEFVGLHATMENIGVVATYSNQIGGIVSKRFSQAYKGNSVAYRTLMRSKSRSPRDYISVTVDCALNNFDTYTDALKEIGRVLRKARTQIAEPYTSRLRIYHETGRTTQGKDTQNDTQSPSA